LPPGMEALGPAASAPPMGLPTPDLLMAGAPPGVIPPMV
jgi:hypothetical protein